MNFLKKNKKLSFLALILIIAYFITTHIYKPHPEIENSKPHFKGNAVSFITKIQSNHSEWNNKIVELSGDIISLDSKGIMINENIYCQFKDTSDLVTLKNNQTINIKGFVTGYDDLLNELKLNQCILK